MSSGENMITAKRLKELFSYDPETGLFTRLVTTSWKSRAGEVTRGARSAKYLILRIDRVAYYCHRLAWLYVHDEWPPNGLDIDHKNGDRFDNRICNLRTATRSSNLMNRERSSRNTSGVTGVSWNKGYKHWEVEIRREYERIKIGYFKELDDAVAARRDAELKYFGQYRRTD